MSGFGNQFTLSPPLSPNTKLPTGMQPASGKPERRDERPSRSSSDEGFYGRNEHSKMEGDEDCNSLTSQTLNADGTPKRPMNAFMIFARRRRPQVSAANQSMRTGEISKILSKEWVSMSTTDKQFYLEQAKQLKETFNTKYPDYVYRRRPNNSRKRRRSDSGSSRSVDPALYGDNPDEYGPGYDLDASPTDGEDYQDTSISPSYNRHHELPPSGANPKFGGQPHRGSIGQSFPPPDPPFRSNGPDSHRLSFSGPNTTDRMGHSIDPSGSPRMSLNNMPYSYAQPSGHPQSPPVFGQDSVGSQQNWQHRNQHWLSSGDRHQGPPSHPKSNSYSPPTTWANPSEPPATNTAQTSNSSGFFPTLNTPFYPSQHNVSSYPPTGSNSPVQPLGTPTSQFDDVNTFESSIPREFSSRMYPSPVSPAVPSPTPPYSLNKDPSPYSQRTLPPMQTNTYPHPQSLSSPSTGHANAQPPYWRG